jgi:hypothetical protein
MGINNLLYQYQNTNEFVCSDGRMSVNGICQAPQPVVEQPVIKQPVINNNQGNGDSRNTFTKDYSKDVKSTFEWDFDKVGNKIANFGTTVKDNINAYDDYVENNFGIPSNVKNVARVGSVIKGVSTYGMAGALVPFAIPFVVGGALNNQAVKEQEAAINREETRDLQGRIDKGDFGSNTLTHQDKGRIDKGGSGSSSDGSKGSRGGGMEGFGGGADRG